MPSGIPAAIEKIVAVSTSDTVFIVSCHRPSMPMATIVAITPNTSGHLREENQAATPKAAMISGHGVFSSSCSKKIRALDSG